MGQAMGWKPWELRAANLFDFDAALEGYLKSIGADTGPDTSDEAIAALDELMARYPDKVN